MAFEPVNVLEESLMLAADHPSSRPRFYEELVKSNIYFITEDSAGTEGGVLKADTKVSIRQIVAENKTYIPVFSSVQRLQTFITEPATYLAMNSLDFFNLTKGTEVLLNPGSEYGKAFSIQEIDSILDGTIGTPHERYVVEKETTVQIGLPANPPTELLSELTKLFRTLKDVQAAYNVLINNPEDGLGPHTLIGIVVSGDWERVMGAAGMVANAVTVPNPPIDFIQLDDSKGEHMLKSYEPFYKRKLLRLFH